VRRAPKERETDKNTFGGVGAHPTHSTRFRDSVKGLGAKKKGPFWPLLAASYQK
jgi:hypothetical protein